MGLQIGNLVTRKEVSFRDLKGKTIAVDAFNAIYQFLSSIRQQDGTPLKDFEGNVTSHLSGLFYRNIALLSEGIKLIYVFDGDYHVLKNKTKEKRQRTKDIAEKKFRTALEEEDIEGMGKYAKGFSKLDKQMIEESKDLLEAMGIAIVNAPGEGEMQAAKLVNSGKAYAVGSQDYDALVVGADRLIQNLTLARKRKTINGFTYISPEMITYEDVINHLGITTNQLICLAILVGTDFNPGGVKGIGPKKALIFVKEKEIPTEIFRELEEQGKLDFDWKEIFEIFKKPNVTINEIDFPKLNEEKIKEILVEKHNFSEDRVERQLEKLKQAKRARAQKTLF